MKHLHVRGNSLQHRLHLAIKEEFPGSMSVKEALFTQGILATMITDYSSQMITSFEKPIPSEVNAEFVDKGE